MYYLPTFLHGLLILSTHVHTDTQTHTQYFLNLFQADGNVASYCPNKAGRLVSLSDTHNMAGCVPSQILGG